MTERLRILVTNDDGIDSAGLHRLAVAARAAGHDVVVAAPATEASGMSAALSAVDADGDGGIEMAERVLPDLDGVPAYAVAASPAFIVLLATRQAFGPPPDLVLSGINRGANTGRAVLHSGTVGAALTAVANGTRGMAVSLDVGLRPGAELHWDTAAGVAAQLLPLVADGNEGAALNVNVPNRPAGLLAGVRKATFAVFGVVQMIMTERGDGMVKMSLEERDHEPEPGTDDALLLQGYVAVTAVRPPTEAPHVALNDLPELVTHRAGG